MAVVKVRIPPDIELPPPEGANFFQFAKVENEAQMLVGYIDILRLANEAGDITDVPEDEVLDIEIVPDITHRFLLSADGLAMLKQRLDELFSKFDKHKGKEGDAD